MPAIARWEKEARALFWPWLTVMCLAPMHFVWDFHGYTLLGFLLGVTVLAAYSFGYEFSHGTLPQLLSLPALRMRIWTEKLVVMVLAVATASAAFAYVWRADVTREQMLVAGLYLVAMTCSATYWTLQARTTFGGVVLAWVPLWAFWWAALLVDYFFPGSVLGSLLPFMEGRLSPQDAVRFLSFLFSVVLVYAGLMLWLGARKLARFQATGDWTDKDLLVSLPRVLPDGLARWFRPQPTEPFLNLLRKEFRLLRPVWMLALLFLVYMACLLTLGIGLPGDGQSGPRPPIRDIAFIVPFVGFVPMATLLAGCLSLGEERKWGTHSWHLTLPVSIRVQWLTKLLVGVFTGVVCGGLLPILVATAATHASIDTTRTPGGSLIVWLTLVALLTLASFWCGCVAHGTVQGALWVVPVCGLVGYASAYGFEWAEKLILSTGSLRDFLVSWLQLDPYSFRIRFGIWVIVPVAAFALYQSRKLFRTSPQEGMRWMIRRLAPLALVALASFFISVAATEATWNPYPETFAAIEKLQVGEAQQQLTLADLVRAAPLSSHTQRWLRGANITVTLDEPRKSYVAIIHLASGLNCRMAIRQFHGYRIRPSGELTGCGR